MSDSWGLHTAAIDYDRLDDEPPQDRDDEVDCPSCGQISLLHEVSRNGGHCLYCGVYDHNLDLGRRHGRRSRTRTPRGPRTAAADEYHQIDEWGNHARDGHWDYADPDVDMHMNGECWEWALWHKKYNPHLRIGIEWKWQDPEDRDYPEDDWIPIHAFTHDDHWAYDARGAFPLSEWRKWMGWDDVTFNHEPRVIGGSESYPSSNENIPTEGMAASAGTKPPLPTAPPKMVKQDGDWRIFSSTDGIRYAHVVEADVAEDLRRVAMPAPMPEGITFHHHPTNDTIPTEPWAHNPKVEAPLFSAPAVEARHNGETVGYLEWDPPLHATVVNGIQYGDHPPEVSMIKVHPDYRRHGIATALFDFARRHQGDLEHSDSRTGLGNLWVDYEQSRRALARLAAAVGEDLLGHLHDEFHKWVAAGGDEIEGVLHNFQRAGEERGPIGNWANIENFLRAKFPAAHRGLESGVEEAQPLMDQRSGVFGDPVPSGFDFYETGPEAVAKYGYDPREVAAGMLLLHNRSHPHRSDLEQGDLDRLSEIARIRSQQQRRTHGRRTAMGQRGPLPDGLTFQYHHDEWEPSVTAHVGDREVGYLSWFAGHPDDYRRELLEGADEGETLASMGISGFGEPVGSAPHDQDLISWPNTVSNVGVDDEWRRRGIALALFDHAKANHNPDLMHSFDLTPDGYEFSQAERGRHRTARAPWNPAGTPLYRGVRIRWSPEEVVRLRDLHDSGEHEALAHAILDRAQHGSTVGEWHRPRKDGGLGVFWSGDHGVSRGYGHHGDGHDPDPAGPFENVVVQTDGRHDPDDEWTPYDEDWPHDEEPNDFLNEDRETDLVEGAPVSVTHVHVNAPGGPLSIPLTRQRRMTAMAVLPEGHEGPAEPHYDPDVDVRHWNPDDDVVAPEGATWYHVSPHKLKPGDVLVPSGGDSFFDEEGFYDSPNTRARKRWVWTDHDPRKVEYWMSTIFDSHMRGYSTNPLHWAPEDVGNEPPLYVYRIQPHSPPQPWDGRGGQGWVTGAATVLGLHMKETGPWMERRRKLMKPKTLAQIVREARTAAAGKDPYDAQREAMAHVGHLRHYIDRGTHPEIGGFDPGPTIAGHPAAHHPILTNHWAAEVVRPPAGGQRFGRRVQDATGHYVKALGGMATQGSTGAASELEDAHNGLHVELQHGGHIVVPSLSGFSPLPDPADVRHLAVINPRLQHGMELPAVLEKPTTPEEARALMETLEARSVGYHVNCQRSCLALDARHRGLNVEARPNYWNPVHDRENSDEQWTDEYLAGLWEDERGFPARWIDTDDQFQLTAPSPAHWDSMRDEIAKWGPGGRGLIAMTQRDPTKPPGHPDELFRHVVSAHVDRGGKVSFIDPQIADTAHEWRDRVCYGYYPTGLFTPDHRKRAETDLERMGFGDYDKARARNLLYSPLRYMRIDDKRLTDEAAQHLVNRGTAGPVPILPGGRPEPRTGPSSAGSVFL